MSASDPVKIVRVSELEREAIRHDAAALFLRVEGEEDCRNLHVFEQERWWRRIHFLRLMEFTHWLLLCFSVLCSSWLSFRFGAGLYFWPVAAVSVASLVALNVDRICCLAYTQMATERVADLEKSIRRRNGQIQEFEARARALEPTAKWS